MSSRIKRKHRMSFWDKADMDVLEATSEHFRIEVDRAFQKFLADDSSKEYSFPSNLNNFERKHIHQKAATYNLSSRSHGKDPNRVLTIYKKGNKSNFESFYIDITPEAVRELDKVIQTYTSENPYKNTVKLNCNEKVFGKLSLGPPPEVAEPKTPSQIKKFQQQLPIYEMKNTVIDKIRNNDVLIISSETGSGKTTQIPQYIMDDAREKGENCRILCTQPRRISAVSVAERVSQERGSVLGETVGYHIRLESKLGTNCNLIYCTNGVLIRSLMSGDRVLSSLTHIIIDEVHERDKLSDFLLICLRESLRKGVKIKLILMSATINVDKFQSYFMGAEVLSIPGRLFSIKQFFLDDVLELTGYDAVVMERRSFFNENSLYFGGNMANVQYDDIIMQCIHSTGTENEQAWAHILQYILTENMPVNYQHSETGLTALIAAVYQDNIDMVEKLCGLGSDPHIQSKSGITAISLAEDKHLEEILLILNMTGRPALPREDLLTNYYKICADEDINFDLLIRLISTIHSQYHNGAILVFLPGYDDIMICNDRLMETDLDKSTYRVFFLHGSMNIKEQHEVFKTLPKTRKIILSTNIAETSLTIDDVVYVIDCGKAKVQTYDSCSGLSSLQTQWISKACVRQRAGRAGRTQSGVCFHLFSRTRYDSFLEERIPEILRVPLEELCLNTKTLAGNLTSIYNFLVMAPDPPSPNTVKTAIENLECLGALDKDENLTPLGEYLSQLTIEPHLGKMLIYSVIFKCLDPILTIVASLAQKDPFQLPPQANLRTCATEKRKSLMANTFSDHMIYLKAFIKWQDSVRYRKEKMFCRDFFISPSTMETILKTRSQLLGQLRAAKFVPPNGNSIVTLNTHSENWPLVKAVISSGLYPKLAFKKNGHFCTRTEKKVLIHNSSPLSKENMALWLVYDEMVKVRNGHQVRGVTPVTPVTISLMCGIKTTSPMENYLEIDEWLEFEFPSPHIIYLRKFIETIIEKKLLSPTNALNDNDEAALNALAKILIAEDRNANLVIPLGIKQKPKFFELNRALETTSSDTSSDYKFYNNCSNVQNNFPRFNRYPQNQNHVNNGAIPRTNGHFPSDTASYYTTNGYTHYQIYDNGNSSIYGLSQNNGRTNYLGVKSFPHGNNGINRSSNSNYFNQMNPTSVAASSQMSFMNAIENGPSTSGTSAVLPPYPNFDHSVFVLIRVKQDSSMKIAYESNKWIFSPQTEKQVISYDNGGLNVYLIYTVPKMNTFSGIAKYISINRNRQKPSANIEWIFMSSLPYKKVTHLRNLLNNSRLIYDGVDGQIIDVETAIKLWDLYRESEKKLY